MHTDKERKRESKRERKKIDRYIYIQREREKANRPYCSRGERGISNESKISVIRAIFTKTFLLRVNRLIAKKYVFIHLIEVFFPQYDGKDFCDVNKAVVMNATLIKYFNNQFHKYMLDLNKSTSLFLLVLAFNQIVEKIFKGKKPHTKLKLFTFEIAT